MASMASLRLNAFLRQKGRCIWCGAPMALTNDNTNLRRCTAEHLYPRAKGGNDCPGNVAAACMRCNTERGDGTAPAQGRGADRGDTASRRRKAFRVGHKTAIEQAARRFEGDPDTAWIAQIIRSITPPEEG